VIFALFCWPSHAYYFLRVIATEPTPNISEHIAPASRLIATPLCRTSPYSNQYPPWQLPYATKSYPEPKFSRLAPWSTNLLITDILSHSEISLRTSRAISNQRSRVPALIQPHHHSLLSHPTPRHCKATTILTSRATAAIHIVRIALLTLKLSIRINYRHSMDFLRNNISNKPNNHQLSTLASGAPQSSLKGCRAQRAVMPALSATRL